MKLKMTMLFFWATIAVASAQMQEYYNSINLNASPAVLKNQLAVLIQTTHTTPLNYTPDVWNLLKSSDVNPSNNAKVLLIYGFNDNDVLVSNHRTRDKNLSCHTSECNGLWVREHVFPRSLGTPNLGFEDAGADAHHLRPIDNQMNGIRSNRKFATGSGNAGIVANGNFFPGDEWKGDVARMMMYMYLRYPTQCKAITVGVGSTSYSSLNDMPNIFLEWNAQDPVSDVERKRNDVIQVYQGNRNPFIDNPYLATLIWNGPAAENKWAGLSVEEETRVKWTVYPTVTTGLVYVQDVSEEVQATYVYKVYNMLGQLMTSGITHSEIDMSSYRTGMYLLMIQSGEAKETVKILKK